MNEWSGVAEGGIPARDFYVGDRAIFEGREVEVTGSAYWLGRSGWLLAFDGGDYIYFWRSARLVRAVD